ncbi:hypothetical protein ACJJTC_004446 [Scirpophaga incertulas]
MKAEASKFTFSELYKHAANFNAKATMNGVDLFIPSYKLTVDKLYDLTCAIYIIAFIKRYDASNIVATIVNEIKNDRELESKTFMSKILDLCIKKFSRSNTFSNIRYAIYTKIGLKKLYTVEQLDIAQTYTFDEIIELVALNNDSIDNPIIKSVVEMDAIEEEDTVTDNNYSLGKISKILSDMTVDNSVDNYVNNKMLALEADSCKKSNTGHFLTKLSKNIENRIIDSVSSCDNNNCSYLTTVQPGEKYSKKWCEANMKFVLISGDNMMCCFNAIIKSFRLGISPVTFKIFLKNFFDKFYDDLIIEYPNIDIDQLDNILSNEVELGDTNVLNFISYLFNVSFVIIMSHCQYYRVGRGPVEILLQFNWIGSDNDKNIGHFNLYDVRDNMVYDHVLPRYMELSYDCIFGNDNYKYKYRSLIEMLYDSSMYLTSDIRSRAAAKLAEILLNNGVSIKNIKSYLEIGAAPGACYKLIEGLASNLDKRAIQIYPLEPPLPRATLPQYAIVTWNVCMCPVYRIARKITSRR